MRTALELLALAAVAGVLAATSANAMSPAKDMLKEKCYGLSDEARNSSTMAVKKNGSGNWTYVQKGTCVALGGSPTEKNACNGMDRNSCHGMDKNSCHGM